MTPPELTKLISNHDRYQLKALANVVARSAAVRSERFTGKISFDLDFNGDDVKKLRACRSENIRKRSITPF